MYRESRKKLYDVDQPTIIEIQYNRSAHIWHVLFHREGKYYTHKYGALSYRQVLRMENWLLYMGFMPYFSGIEAFNGNEYVLWRKES